MVKFHSARNSSQHGIASTFIILGVAALVTWSSAIYLGTAKSRDPSLVSPISQTAPNSSSTTPEPQSTPATEEIPIAEAKVIHMVDATTLEVEINDKSEKINLIGVDDPSLSEVENDCVQETPLESINDELAGKYAYVVKDATNHERDDEGHLLRYVFFEDAISFNQKLILDGIVPAHANPLTPHMFEEEFKAAQTEAKKEKRGIWSETCEPFAVTVFSSPVPTPSPTPTPTPTPSPTSTPVPIPTLEQVKLTLPMPIGPALPLSKKLAELNKEIRPPYKPLPTISLFSQKNQASIAPSGIEVSPTGEPKEASLNSDLIFELINAHRVKLGKAAFEKETRLCELAVARGPQLYKEIFVTRNMHSGLYSQKLPFWITENMAHYGSEQTIVNWWLNSYIHRKSIESDYKYSCGTCVGNSCAQLFTSYTPK